MLNSSKPPALVLGRGVTALGVMRGLAGAGIAAYVIGARGNFVARSRHYQSHPLLGGGDLMEGELAPFLAKLADRPGVLIPCSDDWLRAVTSLPADLIERFPFSLPPASAIEDLTDKARFARLLTRMNLPLPDTWVLDDEDALDTLPDAAFQNTFLKPCNSQAFARAHGVKAYRPDSRGAAERLWRKAHREGHELILQAYIPGPPTEHFFIDGFIDRSGAAAALFARRRLRMHPLDFGNSTHLISIPLAEMQSAADDTLRLLGEIAYRGIFSVEFKRHPRDGQFKFLEINARPWWYIGFAHHCGVDVTRMAYEDALGRDVVAQSSYAVGERCTYLRYDVRAARSEIRGGRLRVGTWLKSLWGSNWPVFSWEDPAPALSLGPFPWPRTEP